MLWLTAGLLISSCIIHLVQRKEARFSLGGLNVSEAEGPAGCPKEQLLSKAAPGGFVPCPDLKIIAEQDDYICQEKGN